MTAPLPWVDAWSAAAATFWRTQRPGDHFATSTGSDPATAGLLAEAIIDLLVDVDSHLNHPDPLDVVDVGAGDAGLLHALAGTPGLPERVRLTGVDLRGPPAGLDARVRWVVGSAPQAVHRAFPRGVTGLVLAVEWLDEIPCTIGGIDDVGVRRVDVDPLSGIETNGPVVTDPADLAWVEQWWPAQAGRVEIGRSRDDAWVALASAVRAGTLLAIDYAHTKADRRQGRWSTGTLAAYRHGRRTPAVPDGTVNLTCHVALDACAAALERSGRVRRTSLMSQSAALRHLRPEDLRTSAALRLLCDPAGLGSHTWLRQDLRPASTLPA